MSRVRYIRLPPWLAYVVAGLAAIALYYAWANAFARGIIYDGIGASSAAAVVAAIGLHRPARVAPWLFFAAGLLAFTVGDVIFNLYDDVWHTTIPFPSVADVFYLSGYPLLAAGIGWLIFGFQSQDRWAGLVDAALITGAFALVQWIFLMKQLVHEPGSALAKAVDLSYPAMDVVLLGGLAVFSLTPAWRTTAFRLLAASLLLLLFADEVYLPSPGSYASTTWLDSGWLLSYIAWGAGALHPSMTVLSDRRSVARPRLTPGRIAVLAAALLTAPVVLVIERLTGRGTDAVALVVGATVLAFIVLGRLGGFVRRMDRLRVEERVARSEAEAARRLLQQQNERLREADRVKDEFVALISHDLRTPLTSIMGYAELAMDDPRLHAELRTYLEVVERNSERLLHLVNDLLFVARLEAGQLELAPTELDLAAVARQAAHEHEPRAKAKGIDLQCDTPDEVMIAGDRGRIFQLFDNLISNAIKFTPEGGRIDVRVARNGNDSVRVEIADTGIGIASEEQRQLFDRFFRASSARSREIPGTGLGLYISRAIVEAHGGSIGVESDANVGTTFWVELPVSGVSAPTAELVA